MDHVAIVKQAGINDCYAHLGGAAGNSHAALIGRSELRRGPLEIRAAAAEERPVQAINKELP